MKNGRFEIKIEDVVMECNECEKEVASIYMVCPDCFDAKDKEITALRTQLKYREEGVANFIRQIRGLQAANAELQAQLADREIEAKAKDLLIETQRAALTSQQWVIDSLKETLARAER